MASGLARVASRLVTPSAATSDRGVPSGVLTCRSIRWPMVARSLRQRGGGTSWTPMARCASSPTLSLGPVAGALTYVADSKYKVTADGFGREADQLLACTSALSLPEGLLIYCQHDGSTPPS